MIASFIHDHYFVLNEKDNLYYDGSGGVFDYKLWNRYLEIFDKLIVVGREADKLPNKLVVSSADNVSFVLINDLKSGKDRFLKASEIKKKLQIVIKETDFLIIRVPSTLGYFAQSICREEKKPYVLEVVGCPWDAYWNYGSLSAKLMAPFEMLKLKSVTKKAKSTIYVTKNFLQKRYPTDGREVGISNVNISNVLSEHDACAFYENFKKEQTFLMGLIGSFHVKYKGHIEALLAIKDLVYNRRIQNIKLLLVGTGNYSWLIEEIKKYDLTNYVEILGALESGNSGILPFLQSIHLYIHPSKQEGLPRVVIEALSMGRLCLASSTAGTPELLNSKYLHTPGDWKELSNQIFSLYQNSQTWTGIIKDNLITASGYLEHDLQNRRVEFIKERILNK